MTSIAELANDAALYGVGVVRRPQRASLDRYLREALMHAPAACDARVRDAVEQLVAAALSGPPGMARRCGMLIYDANPVLFSYKSNSAPDVSFRVQTDVGLVSLSAQEHLDCAEVTVRRLLDSLGWQHLAAHAQAWMRCAFDAQPDNKARTLHLGLVLTADSVELRLYCNPGGPPQRRWESLAALASLFGTPGVERQIGRIAGTLERAGAPVVIALCLHAGAIAGVRPYIKANDWESERLRELLAFGGIAGTAIGSLAVEFSRWRDRGGFVFTDAAPSVAFDFPVSDGALHLEPTRTKIDFPYRGLGGYPHRGSAELREQIARLHADVGLSPLGALGFLDDLDRCFAGARVEWVSAGMGERSTEMTLYAAPEGLASLYRL